MVPENGDAGYCAGDEVLAVSTRRNTATASFISSMVPSKMRVWLFSKGGKSRPTRTFWAAQPSRKSFADRLMSTNTWLVWALVP